jgi:prepilin-type N-terminal cleavage/methylation domain-containing protein
MQLAVSIRPMRPLQTRERAFTLIELLVVIAIIAILVGLLFPAFKAVQNQARQTQAKNDLTQIVNAVNAFYTEYGKYPLAAASTDTCFNWSLGPCASQQHLGSELLFNELRACTASDTVSCSAPAMLNTRQIVYISPPIVKDPSNPRSGIATSASPGGASTGRFFDPWGSPYNVVIDSNYDNGAVNIYGATGGAGVDPILQGVVAWSNGLDLQVGTNSDYIYRNPTTGAQSDDVISWQ